eukprot:1477401-Amphidinium_carterae.1
MEISLHLLVGSMYHTSVLPALVSLIRQRGVHHLMASCVSSAWKAYSNSERMYACLSDSVCSDRAVHCLPESWTVNCKALFKKSPGPFDC